MYITLETLFFLWFVGGIVFAYIVKKYLDFEDESITK